MIVSVVSVLWVKKDLGHMTSASRSPEPFHYG